MFPWADPWHCLVGLAYVFNDDDRIDFLVYMSPGDGPGVTMKVHRTSITMLHGRIGVRLASMPNPETDPVVVPNEDGTFFIDPAPND